MGQVSPFLRKTKTGFCYFCPGCDRIHCVSVNAESGPNWTFNGNVDKPTFGPSVRHFWPAQLEEPEHTFCHYFIVDGEIRYCGDCDHELKGKTVPLPPIPDRYRDDKYGWPE